MERVKVKLGPSRPKLHPIEVDEVEYFPTVIPKLLPYIIWDFHLYFLEEVYFLTLQSIGSGEKYKNGYGAVGVITQCGEQLSTSKKCIAPVLLLMLYHNCVV